MKAVLSNRIILNVDKELQERIISELTYRIPQKYAKLNTGPEIIKTFSRLKDGIFSIPSGRMDLIPADYEIIDKRVLVPVEFPKFKFPLRESQQVVFDDIDDNAIVNAPVSWGKTFAAIAIATKLSQKTLVVTHTTMLRDQWVKEVEKTLGIEAGVIGSGKFNIDSPIVIGNVQTLTRCIPQISDVFGTLILDECLDYESLIFTKEYGSIKLGTIVNKKLKVTVRSLDPTTGMEVFKPVVRWFKHPEEKCLRISHSIGSIKATKNHNFYIEEDGNIVKKQAQELNYDDRLIFTLNAHKSLLELKESSLPIILGCVLGDGNLSKPNPTTGATRIRITQGEAQLYYLLYKEKLLNSIMPDSTLHEGNSGYSNSLIYQIATLSFIDSYNLYDSLYTDGKKKKISKYLASKLNVLSWSLIYQDDGSGGANNVSFSFCELDIDSIDLLGKSLINNNLCNDYYIYTCKKGYNYLKLNANNSHIFYKEIAKYIHPTMRYKLPNSGTLDGFIEPIISKLHKDYYTRPILSIKEDYLTNGYRYNIEVEGTHTYFANNVLVSNCHHTPATTFSSIIDKCKARYKIGLSGTLERKDGKHVVFNDYFGFNIYKPDPENCMTPEVLIVNTDIIMPSGSSWADKVTNLENHTIPYRKLVVELADSAVNVGHKVLVVGARVDFLEKCARESQNPAAVITGAVKRMQDRQDILDSISTGDKHIIYGTCSIFAEGISQNDLSCIILATPINNDPMLTQLIGRIVRLKEGKKQPLIIDINLKGSQTANQARHRYSHYLRKGYKIRVLDK